MQWQMYLSLLVAILGALAYVFSSDPKVMEMGRLAFVAGLLVFLLVFSGSTSKVLK